MIINLFLTNTTMLSSDTRIARVKTNQQDVRSIIYQMSLFSLLKVRQKLKKMTENGEIEMTTAELDRSLASSLQKLTTAFERQMTAANLWQIENRCPQCELRLMPLLESCVCGYKTPKGYNCIETSDLKFVIAENCAE